MKIGLVSLLILISVSVNAHESRLGYATHRSCYKETYREEYVARTKRSQGYLKSLTDRVVVPCSSIGKVHNHRYHLQNQRSIPAYNYSRNHHYYKPTNQPTNQPKLTQFPGLSLNPVLVGHREQQVGF